MNFHYKNIIFDLGNVIQNVDATYTIDAFSELGIPDAHSIFQIHQQNALCDQHERGEISSEDFCQALVKLAKPNTTAHDIKTAWNLMLRDIPKQRIAFLQALKQGYNIFALSNTNKMHVITMNENLRKLHGIDGWHAIFHKCYYSHEVGMRKPESRIFEHIIKDANLNMSETIFLDDQITNVEAAKTIGLAALQIKPGYDLAAFMNEHHDIKT